ncbi:zinc finger E-box-binding homeobox 1-like isoform X1 [Onychostoma macrolepis]|uniref:zinc finger E-box-binding homeobox 1-like isoform X1 n=1 Tax=Onychostoma macrolepis TaxID=369639 RepID=UPI00272D5DF7|nr:zinc finger E-box-binding homeobox 1-like isoform X1 [Onychostoma macrolepis]XP_058603022.1 zinc finger E-box-binding homeobox 1-like isoform X1 [Onychostoma macrolepis]
MRKQQTLDRIGETIPHIKWTDLTLTKDSQMSVGQEGELSDEGLSLRTESKDKVTPDVFLVPPQEQTEVIKDYSKQNSPKNESDSDQMSLLENQTVEDKLVPFHENTRSLPTNMQLIPKVESDNATTEACEVTTKATNIANISSNDLLEIKVQRQSILSKGFHNDKLPLPGGGNHTSKELCIENKTQVVDVAHARGSKLRMDLNANKEKLEYSKDCTEDYKTQSLCNVREERLDIGRNIAVTSSLGQYEEDMVLDLSLPKKKDRNKERKCEWVVDPEYEGSLHMEVDEIEEEHVEHVEVEQEDDDNEICWIPSVSDAHTYLPQHWDGHLCSSSLEAMPTVLYPNIITPDPMDTLLIDDQGIPYTLTADGQKVPQIDNIQHAEGLSEQTDLSPGQAEDKPSFIADVQDITDSRQQTLPKSLCPNMSIGHVSVESSQVAPNQEPKSSYSSVALDKPSIIPAMSDMASVPIQIVANTTGSNTPILLLPPSQLQSLSSPASKANPGLITLSLPVPLSQNTQSSPMFLVLSSPQVSSTQSSSSPGKLSQISSSSTVALPLATCPLDLGSTLSSRPSLLSLSTVSSATATDISGLNNPSNLPASPTSSTASSSTSTVTSTSPTKQFSTDAYSDTPVPTSFREALLRLAVSVEKKQENQPETHSVTTPSCSEATKPDSSATVHESENKETEVNCDGETESTTVDQTDSLDTTSSTSPIRPVSPGIPINDPKNQALGPRRILYCQYCPRVFYYLSDLERHSITHSQSKPHVCHLCGKAFKRSSHLERHKHIHTGQRNFVCQLCPRRFRESGELMRHQRVHTGEKPFQCLICHMRFAERNTLRRHTKRKHQGQQLEAMDMKAKPESGGIALAGIQGEPEENAEWYSSTVPEMESDSDTGGE